MNRIFNVVWSKAIGQWVVTSEFGIAAGGRSRRSKRARPLTGPLATLSLMTALALYGASAMAAVDINNVGFETGTLEGWTYSQTGTQSPTGYTTNGGVGASVVTGVTDLTTSPSMIWTLTASGQYMASLQANPISDPFSLGANALGLTSASQSSVSSILNGNPTTSSWLYQDLTLAAGDYFTMAWQYVSTDNAKYNDASLTSLVNLDDSSIFATVNNQLAQYALLGATAPGTGSYSTGSFGATGWQLATYKVDTAGTYRLGFLSFNLNDKAMSPILLIDSAPGLTYNGDTPFLPVPPNPGTGAPVTPTQPTGPVVIDGPKGTDDLGTADKAEFAGGTLVVDKDTTVAQDLTIDDKPGTIDQNGHASTFTGEINDASTGTPGTLIITNSGNGGSVTLSGENGYTGSTVVEQDATLALAGNGSIAASSRITVDGTLDVIQASGPVSITSLDGSGMVQLGNTDLVITAANDIFAGNINGQGGVSIEGGTQILSGENTYAGGTSISNQAVLEVRSNGNLGAAAGGLTFNDGTLHSTGNINADRDVLLNGEGRFNVSAGTSLINRGDVSGNGALVKNGEGIMSLGGVLSHAGGTTVNHGMLVLTGQNTYTGGTTINSQAVLQIIRDDNLGDAAGSLTLDNGTLHNTANIISDRDVLLKGDGHFNTGINAVLYNSGDVSGNGALVKEGEGIMTLTGTLSHAGGTTINNGTVLLSGQNTYTGGTTLNGGTLYVGSNDNLGDAAGGVIFNGGTLYITGNVNADRDLLLQQTATITTDQNTTLSNSGDVSGSGGLIKNGLGSMALSGVLSHAGGTVVNDGVLKLSGQNDYTGGTLLNGGVLQISSNGNLGHATSALTFNGGQLHSIGNADAGNDLLLLKNAIIDVDAGTVLSNSGAVSGNGGLTKNGQGSLSMSGTLSHAGGTTVNKGVLVLSGQNTYTGGTRINLDGVLQLNSNSNLGDAAGALTFNGGRLHSTGNASIDNDMLLPWSALIDVDANALLSSSGAVSGNGGLVKNGLGSLSMSGVLNHAGGTTVNNGLLVLTGQNTFTGGTTLNGGVLQISSNGNLGDAAGALTFNGGTLHSTGNVDASRDMQLQTAAVIATDAGTALTNSGAVSGSGALIKDGQGSMSLSGTLSHAGGTTINNGLLVLSGQNTFTGGTTLNGGVLQISSNGNLGDAAGALTFNGGTLHSTGNVDAGRDMQLQTAAVIATDAGTALTNSGAVSGSGALIKDGQGSMSLSGTLSHAGGTTINNGLLVLSGQNTFTGGTTLNGGVLQISSNGNLGDAAGALTFNGGQLHSTGNVDADRDMQLQTAAVITTDAGTTLTNSGAVSGSGALIKDGQGNMSLSGTLSHAGGTTINNGLLVLSGQNTFTGGTTLNGGVLQISSNGNLGDAAGALTFNGGTLHSTGDIDADRDLLLQKNAVIHTDASTVLLNRGDVSGNGALIKDGKGVMGLTGTLSHAGGTTINDGLVALTGKNTYTGGTTLNGGMLQISSNDNLGDAAGVLTFNGGRLLSYGNVDADRDMQLQAAAIIATEADTTLTNSGDVSGSGELIKQGQGSLNLSGTLAHAGGTTLNSGVLVLSGQNTYTGGTTLNGGILQISSNDNLGDAAGVLTFNGGTLRSTDSLTLQRELQIVDIATLDTAADTRLTLTEAVSGAGVLLKQGAGSLVLDTASTHRGGTVITAGSVVLANAGGLGQGALVLSDATLHTTVDTTLAQSMLLDAGSTLQVDGGTTTTLAGAVDGSANTGCFTKTGAGRLNLSGTAVMAGGLCINEGTLSNNGLLASHVQIDRAATLRGTGIISGDLQVDGTLAPGNSPGTLVVNGSVSMTDGATLQIDIDGYGTGNGAGNYSRVILNGVDSTFVANGTLHPVLRGISGDASNTFTPKLGDMFRIVSGEGGVSGTFDALLQPSEGLAAGTRFQVYYTTGYDIDLYVTPTQYAEQLRGLVNGNVMATANALDSLIEVNDSGASSQQQTDLLRAVWQQNALSLPEMMAALTGQNHAQLAALAQANATALGEDVSSRLSRGTLLQAGSAPIEQMLWANMAYGDLSVDAGTDADALDARQRRASAGIDVYRSDRLAWGAGLGRTTSDLDGSRNNNGIDSNALFAYAVTKAGAVLIDGMLGYSADRWQSQRIDALSPSQQLRSKASGTTRMASAGVSLPFSAAGLNWQPSLRGSWHKVERNAFAEGGDSLAALDLARYQGEGGRALLGLSVGSLQADPLQARATWQLGLQGGVNFGQSRQAEVLSSLGGEDVRVRSAEAGKSFGRAELQATLRLGSSSYLYGGISSEQGSGVENNSVNAGIRIAL